MKATMGQGVHPIPSREGLRRLPGGQATAISVSLVALFSVWAAAGSLWAQAETKKSKMPWRPDPKSALEEARKEGKLVLLHFGADWCSWCKKMDVDTFGNGDVATACAKAFVCVDLDVDKHKDLVKQYQIDRVPTAVVLLPDGDLIELLDGYAPAGEFKEWLGHVSEDFARFRKAEEKARKSPDDPEATCQLVESMLRLNLSERAAKASQAGLSRHFKGGASTREERMAKAELLVHLGDAYLDLGESPKKILGVAKDLEELDPGGKLGFEVRVIFLRAATDDLLSHELEEDARELETKGKKAPAAKSRTDARKLQTSVLSRLEECLEKYPENDRSDAILMWLGHLIIEVRNDPAAARKMFERVIEKYPNSAFLDEARQKLRDLSGEKPKSDQKDKKP